MAKIHKLTALEVQRTTRLGWIPDGGGLYLRVRKDAVKTWKFRVVRAGKNYVANIGPVHTISLKQARDISEKFRAAIIEGKDPRSVLEPASGPKTFKDAAEAIIERRRPSWKSEKTAIKWRRSLMDHAKPLHEMPVGDIDIKDVESVLMPIWYTQNHSARNTRGKIEQALDLATVLGWRSGDNPARWRGCLEHLLPDHKPRVIHHAALPYKDMSTFFAELIESSLDTRDALAFTIMTAVRGHMVREAVWAELDIAQKLWTVPAERMKRSQEDHLVPLTDQMIAVLPPRSTGLVFPYRRGGFSENAFKSALKALGYGEYTAHGFRSTFKDWAADLTDYPDEMSELALAHKVGSTVRRSYRRTKGIEKRRRLMQDWCDFLFAAGSQDSNY